MPCALERVAFATCIQAHQVNLSILVHLYDQVHGNLLNKPGASASIIMIRVVVCVSLAGYVKTYAPVFLPNPG